MASALSVGICLSTSITSVLLKTSARCFESSIPIRYATFSFPGICRIVDPINPLLRKDVDSMLVDEMLAICAEIETWREKKESQEAQARYNAWLYYKKWEPDEEE